MGNAACCREPVPANDHRAYLLRAGTINTSTGALQSARLQPSRHDSARNSARSYSVKHNSTRNSSSRNVRPDKNLLVVALVADFKEVLMEKFKSREEAFGKIGGDDDDNIDAAELNEFLIHIGYNNPNLNAQLFQYLDKDNDGYISKSEFVALCAGHDEHVATFKERLLAEFRTVNSAFHKLGSSFDTFIDYSEFEQFCTNNLGYTDMQVVKHIFEAIDDDHNAVISKAEFKALFDASGEFGLVAEFKETIKAKFKSTMEAFEKLGGNDDGVIDRGEFRDFLDDLLGYTKGKQVDQLFDLIDDNHDGYISKNEFRALFVPQSMLEFRESVRKKYKTRNVAFKMLGDDEKGLISPQSFHACCARDFDFTDKSKNMQLFRMIDCDGDAAISRAEFKNFFLFSTLSGLGGSGKGKPFENFADDEPTSAENPDVDPTSAQVPDAEATSDVILNDDQDTSDAPLLEPKPVSDAHPADVELSCDSVHLEAELNPGISTSNVEPAV